MSGFEQTRVQCGTDTRIAALYSVVAADYLRFWTIRLSRRRQIIELSERGRALEAFISTIAEEARMQRSALDSGAGVCCGRLCLCNEAGDYCCRDGVQ
jgi:hypothetical protein